MLVTSKRPLFTLALLLCLFSCKKEPVKISCDPAFDGWSVQSFAFPGIQKQNAVYFPSERVGYTAGNYGSITKTADGGETWTVIHSGDFTSYTTRLNLKTLFFVNEYRGFAAGDWKTCCYGDELHKGAVLLKTVDGGQSWQKTYFENASAISDLVFFDENEGIALFSMIAGSNPSGPRIMRTEDGGDSWVEVSLPAVRIQQNQFFRSPSTLTIVVSGEHGESLLATSSDKGQSWQIKNGPWDNCNRLYFIDDSTGFAICGLLFFPETVFVTHDGGDTWTQVDYPMTSASLIHFNTPDNGFVINPVYTYESGGGELIPILQSYEASQTSDGGKNWRKTTLDKSCDFDGLAFAPTPNTLFTIGYSAKKFEWK